MEILYSKQAAKYLKMLERKIQMRVKNGIEKLTDEGDIQPLIGRKGEYRLRIGNLRVIYIQKDDTIYVTVIYPRGQAYKKL